MCFRLQFERCLSCKPGILHLGGIWPHNSPDIFAKYCTPSVVPPFSILTITPKTAVMTEEALDQWAIDTNGEAFSADTKEELGQYMDMNDEGHLTLVMILSFYGDVIDKPDRFKGFLQIYVLQTENDEEVSY